MILLYLLAIIGAALAIIGALSFRSLASARRQLTGGHVSGAAEALVVALPPSLRTLPGRCCFYPTLWLSQLRHWLAPRSYRWWHRVDSALVLGALPHSAKLVRRLQRTQQVRAVVNTCDVDEFAGHPAEYRALGIEQLHVPMPDYTSPSLDQVRSAVAFIESRSAQSAASVYVHCKAGKGRSATIALAWLIYRQRLSPRDAYQQLRAIRPQIAAGLDRRQVLHDWYDHVMQLKPPLAASAQRLRSSSADVEIVMT